VPHVRLYGDASPLFNSRAISLVWTILEVVSMADIKHSRDQGRRRDAKHSGKSLLAPTLGVHTTDVGESRLNVKQQYSLDAMYCT
jgi:hypothetical protein